MSEGEAKPVCIHALGAVPLRKASVVATPTLVTIRKLREAYGHTRSKGSTKS